MSSETLELQLDKQRDGQKLVLRGLMTRNEKSLLEQMVDPKDGTVNPPKFNADPNNEFSSSSNVTMINKERDWAYNDLMSSQQLKSMSEGTLANVFNNTKNGAVWSENGGKIYSPDLRPEHLNPAGESNKYFLEKVARRREQHGKLKNKKYNGTSGNKSIFGLFFMCCNVKPEPQTSQSFSATFTPTTADL